MLWWSAASCEAFREGKLRVGRMPIDVEWPDGRISRLRIDIEAATLTFASLLEAGAGSALYQGIEDTGARAAQTPGREAARIDPARAMVRVTEQAGAVSWSIVVTRAEYEYCTRHLIELAREGAGAGHGGAAACPKLSARGRELIAIRAMSDGRYSDPRAVRSCKAG